MALPGILASLFKPENIVKGVGRGISDFVGSLSKGEDFLPSLGKGISSLASGIVGDDGIKENVSDQTKYMTGTNSRDVTQYMKPVQYTNPRNVTSNNYVQLDREPVPVQGGGAVIQNRPGTVGAFSSYNPTTVAPFEQVQYAPRRPRKRRIPRAPRGNPYYPSQAYSFQTNQ